MQSDAKHGSIAVIIVNYGTADLAKNAVESVLAHAPPGRYTSVHIVDNASPNQDAEKLSKMHADRGWGDQVILHLESDNHGFGRGNNIALRTLEGASAQPDYVFLLNPDAQVKENTLEKLATVLDQKNEVGFTGASVESDTGEPASSAFRFPSAFGEFESAFRFGPISRLFSKWVVALPPSQPAGEVDWVTGAAVMARFSALKELEYFRPDFFLYYEEVDLMRRAKNKGWRIWYEPAARVVHIEGASTGVKSGAKEHPRKPAYLYQSWRIYFAANHGRLGAFLAGLAWALGSLGDLIVSKLRGRTPAVPERYFRDLWSEVFWPLFAPERP